MRPSFLTLLAAVSVVTSSVAQESKNDAAARVSKRLTEKEFGAIDQPRIDRQWPVRYGLEDKEKQRPDGWKLAAGRGVYLARCAQCHGDVGSGDGPRAKQLSVNARDFRRGLFKYHTGGLGRKPSRHDLSETVRLGMAGTEMPAFDELDEGQNEAVVEYIRWIAMRGEYQWHLAKDLRVVFDDVASADPEEIAEVADDRREDVLQQWTMAGEADTRLRPGSKMPPMTAQSIARGKELFQGKRFNCFACHGKDGRGADIRWERFHDEWGHRQVVYDLTKGKFKGGEGPNDLYLRISAGIPGTPHPAFRSGAYEGKTEENLWDLVHYVYHLARKRPSELTEVRRPTPKMDEKEERPSAAAAVAIKEIVPSGWGTIRGRVIYDGRSVPKRKRLIVTGGDAALASKANILDASLVVNEENFGLANVVVWLDLRQPDGLMPIHSSQTEPPGEAAVLSCRDFQFLPHVMFVRAGQTMLMRNENSVAVNVRTQSVSSRNRPFNSIFSPGGSMRYEFQAEERQPVRVVSAIHPWTLNYVVVKSHPYVAITDALGNFEIQNVPAGTRAVQLWHERLGLVREATVKGGRLKWDRRRFLVDVEQDAIAEGEVLLNARLFGND